MSKVEGGGGFRLTPLPPLRICATIFSSRLLGLRILLNRRTQIEVFMQVYNNILTVIFIFFKSIRKR